MPKFIKVPTFSIYNAETGEWAKKEQWWLEGELIYESDHHLDGERITVTVPDNFETDLATIPRVARLLIPKNDLHRAPAVVHDYLCRKKVYDHTVSPVAESDFDRKLADKIFLEAMKKVGVGRLRRRLMYFAVRIGAMMKDKTDA